MNTIQKTFRILLKAYGCQGWWPLLSCSGINPTKTGSIKGYHSRDYSYPRTKAQQFEICAGAILAQNTSWVQAEKALLGMRKSKLLEPKKILKGDKKALALAIKPAGYFNQKAKKLAEFSKFCLYIKGKTPGREELLSVWGIGRETADSILLYAYKIPVFVVDAYTRRIFSRMGLIPEKDSYDSIREFFERSQKRDYSSFQEFHALIVEHAKRHCTKQPRCIGCPLGKICSYRKFGRAGV